MIIKKGVYSYAKIREMLKEPKGHFYDSTEYYLEYFEKVIPGIEINRENRKITLIQDYNTSNYITRTVAYKIELFKYYSNLIEELNKSEKGFALREYFIHNSTKVYNEIGQGIAKAISRSNNILKYFYKEKEIIFVNSLTKDILTEEQKVFLTEAYEEAKRNIIDKIEQISMVELADAQRARELEKSIFSKVSLASIYGIAIERFEAKYGFEPTAYATYELVKPITEENMNAFIAENWLY